MGLMDGRLIICGVAVGVGMFALLWDFLYPFPLSRTVLIVCVATYFLLMGVLTLYTTYKQKGPAGLDPDSKWEVASSMEKYDDQYELTLTFTEGKTGAKRETVVKESVGDFIDENGVICQDIIEPLVLKLHKSLASGKKDN